MIINGQLITISGDILIYKNSKLHNEEGPAIKCLSGYKEWYLDGKQIPVKSQEEFEKYINLLAFQ
jgi:hypothetical protein